MSEWHLGVTFYFPETAGPDSGANRSEQETEALEVFVLIITEPFRRHFVEALGYEPGTTRFQAVAPEASPDGFEFYLPHVNRPGGFPLRADYGELWSEWWTENCDDVPLQGLDAVLAIQAFDQHLKDREAVMDLDRVERGEWPQRALGEFHHVNVHPKVQAWREREGAFMGREPENPPGRPKGSGDVRWIKLLCWAQFYAATEEGRERGPEWCCQHAVSEHMALVPIDDHAKACKTLKTYFYKYLGRPGEHGGDRETFIRILNRVSRGGPARLDY